MPRRKSAESHPALGDGLPEFGSLILPPPLDLEKLDGWGGFSPMQRKYLYFRPWCRDDDECFDLIGWTRQRYTASMMNGAKGRFRAAASTIIMYDSSTQLAEAHIIEKEAKQFLLSVMQNEAAKMTDRMSAAQRLIQMGKTSRASGAAQLKRVGQGAVVNPEMMEPIV